MIQDENHKSHILSNTHADESQAQSALDDDQESESASACKTSALKPQSASLEEVGGPSGLEPTRYGDWERNGRCVDF